MSASATAKQYPFASQLIKAADVLVLSIIVIVGLLLGRSVFSMSGPVA
ncbi:MAG: hypothetical protein WC921_03115 [Candidatus Paceibacterota bacterium]